jgi:predicted ATPase
MVGEIASRHALSREVVDGVSERTGGVPLFVEEVTRLLLERGEAGGLQAIPPTLRQSLAARLDQFGEAREVAQIGAVLGRDFSYVLLRALAPPVGAVDQPAVHAIDHGLQSALDRLVDADLLFVQGSGAQATYRFKHALIQDAAYESLLRSRRQALHRRAGELLRDKPESAAAEPEAIARHFTEAGLDDLAIEWWGKAGDQALRRSAFQEAIAHLGKAIAMADKTAGGESQTTPTRRLKLQADYGRAVMWSKGFAAEETEAAFARASDLSLQTESSAEQKHGLYYARWIRSFVRSEMNSARMIAQSFLRERKPRVAEGKRLSHAEQLDRPAYSRASLRLLVATLNGRWPTLCPNRTWMRVAYSAPIPDSPPRSTWY